MKKDEADNVLGSWLIGVCAYAFVAFWVLVAITWVIIEVSDTVAHMTVEDIAFWFIPINVFIACTLQHFRPLEDN